MAGRHPAGARFEEYKIAISRFLPSAVSPVKNPEKRIENLRADREGSAGE